MAELFKRIVRDVTLTLDVSAYADGDLLADTQEIPNIMRLNGGAALLESVVLLDKDDQGVAGEIYILRSEVSMGTENAAFAPSDAAAAEVIGTIVIATGDYVDLINSQIATKPDLDIICNAVEGEKDLWVAVVTRGGTPTHSASGIELKFGFERH